MKRLVVLSAAAVASAAPAFADEVWKQDKPVGGVKVEWREVPSSPFHEYRLTAESKQPLDKLCDAVWGKDAKVTGDFKKRVIIKETDTERWTYEQVKVPLVTDRDCIMHVKLETPASEGRCVVRFDTQEHPDYPPDKHHVRVPTVRGYWELTALRPGQVTVTYVIYSEPGGAVPAVFARGGQRDSAVNFMQAILARAETP
ncbi:MAG: hypothetical protein JNK82_09555 [Myxococcaceae bacterium]|nr:hypothetical protein [Myxococcaceae bacterium]